MRKPRILFCSEASYTNSGFATYYDEVLKRLHATDKYELAELAAYGDTSDPDDQRWRDIPWKFYPVKPDRNNPDECRRYDASTLNQFGEWKFEQTCIDFKPDIVCDVRDWWMCLASGTPILCDNGVKSIEDIVIGDSVLTHKGRYRKVSHVFPVRKHNGDFVTITPSYCHLPMTLTTGHPVLTIKRTSPSLPDFASEKPEWIDSDKLKKGDIVCFPRSKHGDTSSLSEDAARFLGYYAAEGCLLYEGRKSKGKLKGVQLTLSTVECANLHDIVGLANKLFDDPTNSIKRLKNQNTLAVRFYSKEAARLCHLHVPGLSKTKTISRELFNSTRECTLQFLAGLVRGDGGYNHDTERPSYCTSSRNLALQVFQLFVRHGTLPSFSKNKNTCKGKVYHRYIFGFGSSLPAFLCFWNGRGTVPAHKRVDNDYAYLTIDQIDKFRGNQDVFNFEVEEDNSYVSSTALHNCEFAERSPFRQHFHWAIMPTVDAAPQDEQWLSTFASADAVFAYSDWGLELLRQQAGSSITLKTTASPGADLNIYKPVPDRAAHRREMGFNEDCLIVGTVMRNQRRKLYPDLIQAFAQFLRTTPLKLAKNTFLYLHTSWPDLGWDIPKLLKEEGIGHKTVMTYFCRACGGVFPNFFSDARTHCPRCGSYEAGFPNSNSGISREVLANVLNMFDVYVQYANSEGFGMPMVEAAACGIPVMAVDYSAMSDVVRKVRGIPIAVQRLSRESETHCWRALPDNTDFVTKLIAFLSKPAAVRARHQREARQQVEKHYTYEHAARVWENHFDSVPLRDHADTWLSPAQTHEPRNGIPQGLSDEEFVRWGLLHIAGRPDMVNSYTALRMIRDLGWGITNPHMGATYFNESSTIGMTERNEVFNREKAIQKLLDLCSQRNHWEQERTKSLAI